MTRDTRLIEFDAAAYSPDKIMPLRHKLATHPLLTLPALEVLAKRLPERQIRCHANTTTPFSSIERAVDEHPHVLPALEALAHIGTSGSWIALHNIQTDPEYKALLDQALDEVEAQTGHLNRGMFHRAFWVFIQSPYTLTPFHLDHEHNFLMQIQGRKLGRVWEVGSCVSDYAVEVFHAENSRREIHYDESLNALATTIDMVPGVGVFMPYTSPHLVQNGGEVSVTVSMTYITADTHRIETISRGNHALRRFGLKPALPGRHPKRDELKYQIFRTALDTRAKLRGESRDIPGWARI